MQRCRGKGFGGFKSGRYRGSGVPALVGRDAFNVEIALSEGEVEQETPKATGHRLGPVGRR